MEQNSCLGCCVNAHPKSETASRNREKRTGCPWTKQRPQIFKKKLTIEAAQKEEKKVNVGKKMLGL